MAGLPVEKKYRGTAQADTSVLAALTLYQLSLIPQGVTEGERVGRKAFFHSMFVKGVLSLSTSTVVASAGEVVKISLVLDKQCNGAAATTLSLVDTDTLLSFNNLANAGRYKTLWSKNITLNHTAACGNGTSNDTVQLKRPFSFFVKMALPIEFDDVTGAITEIKSNNVFMMTQSLVGGLATIQFHSRVRFTD